jgi:hypothetical protein
MLCACEKLALVQPAFGQLLRYTQKFFRAEGNRNGAVR